MKINKKQQRILFLFVGIFLFATGMILLLRNDFTIKNQYKNYQKTFFNKEKELDQLLLYFNDAPSIDNTLDLLSFCKQEHINTDDFYVFVYQDSTLLAWTTNNLQMPINLNFFPISKIHISDDEWAYIKNIQIKDRIYYVAFPLSSCNKTKIQSKIPIFSHIDSTQLKTNDKYVIVNRLNEPLFEVTFNDNNQTTIYTILIILLLIFGIVFIVFSLTAFLKTLVFFQKHSNLLFILSGFFLYEITKLLFFNFKFTQDLFNPIYYSSHYRNLGDLLTASCILFAIAILFKNFISLAKLQRHAFTLKIGVTSTFLFFVLAFDWYIIQVIVGIVNDSTLTLQPRLLFQYDLMSGIAILSTALSMCTMLIICRKIIEEVFLCLNNKKISFLLISSAIILFFALSFILNQNVVYQSTEFYTLLSFSIAFFTIAILEPLVKNRKKIFFLFWILILSLLLLLIFRKSTEHNVEYEQTIAENYFLPKDPLTQYNLEENISLILSDSTLFHSSFLLENNPVFVKKYIYDNYFSKQLKKYEVLIDLYNLNNPQDCLNIEKWEKKHWSSNLTTPIFFKKNTNSFEYSIKLNLPFDSLNNYELLIFVKKEILSEKYQKGLEKFCFAIYENNYIRKIFGENIKPFKNLFSDYMPIDSVSSKMEFEKDGVSYVVFKNDDCIFLFGEPKTSKWLLLSFIELAIVLNLILFALLLIFSGFFREENIFLKLTFSQILNIFIATFLVVIVIVFLIFTIRFYILTRNDYLENMTNKNVQEVEKIIEYSVEKYDITELNEWSLNQIENTLEDFFELEYLNVNIYNSTGLLTKSYGKGIMSNINISPIVFGVFSKNKTTKIIFEKNKEMYQTIYRPFLNKNGNMIGFFSLLEPQVESFQKTLIKHQNFVAKYIGLGLFLFFVIIFLSFRLIEFLILPLKKVTHSLSKIELGKESTIIQWTRKDEIGQLINNYNILLSKLQTSAELLEKNSQEIAWKKMAKQIAHEVKNPLTPMRLKTQLLLQRLNNDINTADLKDYLQMMLEQIDVLTETASSFSNIAQISKENKTVENIALIVKETLYLFEAEKQTHIVFENESKQDNPLALIDKSQLTRVLTNLIKNSIQARKETKLLNIKIILQYYGEQMWQISVVDNGKGIRKELKNKIFQPNFTTKSSGTGIGLAVVKNIITFWGGEISCESVYGEGTTFIFTLPRYNVED